MEAEEVRGRKERRQESVAAGENTKLQQWSFELLKACDQNSIRPIEVNKQPKEHRWVQTNMKKICTHWQTVHPPISPFLSIFFFEGTKRRVQGGCATTTHFLFLGFFFHFCENRCVKGSLIKESERKIKQTQPSRLKTPWNRRHRLKQDPLRFYEKKTVHMGRLRRQFKTGSACYITSVLRNTALDKIS